MRQEKSCGAIVFRKNNDHPEVLLIKNLNGDHWSFPKGHVEANETEKETALREIKEETGLEVVFFGDFREMTCYNPRPDVSKQVIFFLASALNDEVICQPEEIAEALWVPLHEADKKLTFQNDKQLIFKVLEYLVDENDL